MTLEALKLDILILKGYQMSNCFPKAMTFTKGQRNQTTISRQKKRIRRQFTEKIVHTNYNRAWPNHNSSKKDDFSTYQLFINVLYRSWVVALHVWFAWIDFNSTFLCVFRSSSEDFIILIAWQGEVILRCIKKQSFLTLILVLHTEREKDG